MFDPTKRAVKPSLHIEKLHRTHNVEQFTCGQPELDRFLIRHALQAQQSNSSQTYVALGGDEVVGFYTIVAGEVQHAQAPSVSSRAWPVTRSRCWCLHASPSILTRKAAASVRGCCLTRWAHAPGRGCDRRARARGSRQRRPGRCLLPALRLHAIAERRTASVHDHQGYPARGRGKARSCGRGKVAGPKAAGGVPTIRNRGTLSQGDLSWPSITAKTMEKERGHERRQEGDRRQRQCFR